MQADIASQDKATGEYFQDSDPMELPFSGLPFLCRKTGSMDVYVTIQIRNGESNLFTDSEPPKHHEHLVSAVTGFELNLNRLSAGNSLYAA